MRACVIGVSRPRRPWREAKNRLKVHHSNVDAVMGKYADVMKEIDGNRSKAEVYAEIEGIIDAM